MHFTLMNIIFHHNSEKLVHNKYLCWLFVVNIIK
uniref:Uncharacterized protein n=1 Tax=Arundo donax TaxID=35708 RepID=A0A0A9BZP4_ARUDO